MPLIYVACMGDKILWERPWQRAECYVVKVVKEGKSGMDMSREWKLWAEAVSGKMSVWTSELEWTVRPGLKGNSTFVNKMIYTVYLLCKPFL